MKKPKIWDLRNPDRSITKRKTLKKPKIEKERNEPCACHDCNSKSQR